MDNSGNQNNSNQNNSNPQNNPVQTPPPAQPQTPPIPNPAPEPDSPEPTTPVQSPPPSAAPTPPQQPASSIFDRPPGEKPPSPPPPPTSAAPLSAETKAPTSASAGSVIGSVKNVVASSGASGVKIASFAAVVVAVGFAAFFFAKYQQEAKRTQSIISANQAVSSDLIQRVASLVLVPSETPTIATVTERDKLSKEGFFADAENGDKVLVYSNANKAVLYRPSIDKIISVSGINNRNSSVAGASTSASAPFPRQIPTPTSAPLIFPSPTVSAESIPQP